MKITKKTVIIAALIICVLAAAFIWGGGPSETAQEAGNHPAETVSSPSADAGIPSLNNPGESENPVSAIPEATPGIKETEKPGSSPEPSAKPSGTLPQTAAPSQTASPFETPTPAPEPSPEPEKLTCTLSIRCDTVLANMDKLASGKEDIIPESGYFLYLTDVEFLEGDTVFDVLKRELQSQKLHLAFTATPGTGSVYIDGLFNLYEFDCGSLSGWIFLVNGVSPGISCSEVELNSGDLIEFAYTCDMGKDLGVAQ
ncbi:MAG TPA: DUF4430 domain-containing protein [Clostridiales bacterium]|nr:DUF4430 domain-containing protein [Clostridiales bacterium]